jgi:hypothetical protein
MVKYDNLSSIDHSGRMSPPSNDQLFWQQLKPRLKTGGISLTLNLQPKDS